MTHAYRAFDVDILSDVALPELPVGTPSATPGLRVRRASLPGVAGVAFRPGEADLWWDAVGAFRVRADLVEVDARPGVSDDLLAFPLLGPVLALALHLRGVFALHASGVALRSGVGVALLGDKRAGKSTTAAAFLADGHHLLSDDIVAIDDPRGTPVLLPAWGQVKLAEDAEARFAPEGAEARPQVHEAIDKRRIPVGERFGGAAVPLARLYLLERDAGAAAPRVVPCAAPEALPILVAHAYASRFGPALRAAAGSSWHLGALAALAGSGRVVRLVVPDGIDRLPLAVALVAADASNP